MFIRRRFSTGLKCLFCVILPGNLVFIPITSKLNKHIKVDAEIDILNEECETKVFEKGRNIEQQNQYNHTVFFVDEVSDKPHFHKTEKILIPIFILKERLPQT